MKKINRAYSRPVKAAAVDRSQVSREDVDELVLSITNDGDLYRERITPAIENLKRKYKKGKYDHDLAVKLWQYVADEGVRRYDREFGSGRGSVAMLNPATRKAIAEELRDYYEEEIMYEDDVQASTKRRSRARVMAAKVAMSFDEFKPWSGAVDTWNTLKDFGKLDLFEQILDDTYYDESAGEAVINETELNDLLWFEPETVYEWVGLYYNDETGEVSDEPFDDYDDEEDY